MSLLNAMRNHNTWPTVSVIILNFNGKEFVENCLKTVLDTDYPDFEVITVDNASTDGSIELIEKSFGTDSRVKIVRNKENLGASGGKNVGIKVAKGKYIALLDNDTKVDPSWLKELVKVMEADPKVGSAQSKLLQMDDPKYFDSAGDFMDYYGFTFCRGMGGEDKGQYDRVEEIFSARSAAMIIRRDVSKEVGMFDPKFFFGLVDVDLGWRVRLAGYEVVFVPKSIVYHKCTRTARISYTLMYYNLKNCFAMLTKNYSFKNLVKYGSARILMEIGVAVRSLCLHKNGRAIAVFRAILWNLVKFPHIWKQRLKVQHILRKVSDEYLMERVIKKPFTPFIFNLLPFRRRRLLKQDKSS